MMASWLAAGGSLCCVQNERVRRIISSSKRHRDVIWDFSHEALGCRSDEQTDHEWAERSQHYLENFLRSV